MQVFTCQAIVQFVIDSAQLVILARSKNVPKSAQQETEKQLRVLQTAIQEDSELTKRKQHETLQRKNELESPGDQDEDDDDDGGAQPNLAIQETEELSCVLETNQTASRALSQILSEFSVAQVGNAYYTDFSGSTNNGLQIGHSTGTVK
ncbi:Cytochrome P450 [Penicillium fimorum]|uniref:Cytochrome P450 n=1 Tax=Penicillium fimorum TaxID=1882269 RepID=A0A9X0CB37_9EURO|nr:Cytochrome P450 [Penicillium fimorum]